MNTKKIIAIWFGMGLVYYAIEGLWSLIFKDGYANVIMLFIGGLTGLLIGGLNQIPRFYKMRMIWQALIGVIIVLSVEFVSGLIFNVWLKLGLWNYSNQPFNIMDQICLLFGILWFLLIPAAIWLEDHIRWVEWREGEKYSLKDIYIETFTGK